MLALSQNLCNFGKNLNLYASMQDSKIIETNFNTWGGNGKYLLKTQVNLNIYDFTKIDLELNDLIKNIGNGKFFWSFL